MVYRKLSASFLVMSFYLTGCLSEKAIDVDKVITPGTPESSDDTPSNNTPPPVQPPAPPPVQPPAPPPVQPPVPEPPPVQPQSFYSWGPATDQRVYISGHSLLDNPLADFLVDISSKQSQALQWNQQNILGSPMRVRVHNGSYSGFGGWLGQGKSKSGSAINLINEVRNPMTIGSGNKYNALVIGENHNLIEQARWEDSIRYLKLNSDFYNSVSPTRVFFYHTWLDINKSNPTAWINYETQAQRLWECHVSKVNAAYQAANSNIRVLNLPVSGALVSLVQKIVAGEIPGFTDSTTSDRLSKLFSDNVHYTRTGAYYVAILNYIALYGIKPTTMTLPTGESSNLSLLNQSGTMQALIDHAWTYLNTYYSSGSRTHTMSQCRSYKTTFCATLNALNGYNTSSCTGGVDSVYSDAATTWMSLPN